MTRVTSQRTRQAILVVGDQVDPFLLPENLQLFDTLGRPIDILRDSSRVRWAGVWAPDVAYEVNDMVYHDGFLWIAPGPISVGITPGIGYADPNVEVNRGVMFKQSDRLVSTDPVLYTIGPPPGQRRDNDISAGYSAAILIDKSGVTSGLVVTITPVTSEIPAGLQVVSYFSGSGLDQIVNWSSAEVAGHVPKNIAISDPATDRFIHAFFGGGIDGSFTAKVSSITNLVPPPATGTEWDVLVAQVPIGGTTGQRLAKASNIDYDLEWADPGSAFPVGGSTNQVLAKASGATGDVTWVAPTPRDMPAGGASGALLAKTSSADRDVGWVAPPHDLPVGGASGYMLAKASVADRDVAWVPAPSGGGGSVYELPVGGAVNQVLAKASATDRDVAWVAPTPRDVPVGGTTDQVLAKNSSTDRDLKWATVAGGSSIPDWLYLDERFTVDDTALYTKTGSGPSMVWNSAKTGYVYNASAGDSFYDRNDGHNANLRNVLVAIEIEWGASGSGTPVFSFLLRRQSDRFITIQSHGTNIHIYKTSPLGADSLLASSPATYTTGIKGWLVGMIYENKIVAFWSDMHPMEALAFGAGVANQSRTQYNLAANAEFDSETYRAGRADRIRIADGSADNTNHRIYRHMIIDLDKAPIFV